MNVEKVVERELTTEIEVLTEVPSLCHFFLHKSHMT
jgi:hypothetical protein